MSWAEAFKQTLLQSRCLTGDLPSLSNTDLTNEKTKQAVLYGMISLRQNQKTNQ